MAATAEQDEDDSVFRRLLLDLASSRPDILTSKKRRSLIEQAQETLRNESDARKILAEWSDLRCSSRHAYRRIIPLFTLSLLQDEGDDDKVRKGLLHGLTRLLQLAQDADLVDSCRNELQQQNTSSRFVSTLYELAPTSITAVALGSALDPSLDWLSLLLQRTLSEFSPSRDLDLARSLLNRVSLEEWKTTVSPALQLKLKSHPDKALATVVGWIQHLGEAPIDDEWIELLMKHLGGPKVENREFARDSLVTWATHSPANLSLVSTTLAKAKVTLAPARANVYEALQQIAKKITPDANGTIEDIKTVLEGLVTMIAKETKTEQRVAGQRALMEWLILAKQCKEKSGYETALAYIRECVESKNLTDTGPLLTMLVQQVHPDLLGSMVVDLWNGNQVKKWYSGLESLVVAAHTKKAVQVEGLLAVYLSLIYAMEADKTIPGFALDLISTGIAVEPKSFLYASSMVKGTPSNAITSLVLSRSIAVYTKLAHRRPEASLPSLFSNDHVSSAARSFALCIINPSSVVDLGLKDQYATNAIMSSVNTILTYQPESADSLVTALLEQVNIAAMEVEEEIKALNSTRTARESDKELTAKGQGSENAAHRGFDANAVRKAARLLSRHCHSPAAIARVLVLMHSGSSLRSEGHQRAALIVNTRSAIEDVILPCDVDITFRAALAEEIQKLATQQRDGALDIRSSMSLHEAALSLLTSLGGIASNFSPASSNAEDPELKPYVFAYKLCIDDIAVRLNRRLDEIYKVIESISESDIALYKSQPGVLFQVQNQVLIETKKFSGKKLNEDEMWELSTKKEIEDKRTASLGGSPSLTAEEKKQVAQQDERRQELSDILEGDFTRSLSAVRSLCLSDIEVGNVSLPVVMESVLRTAVSVCPAIFLVDILKSKCIETLTALASCVYEIDDKHTPTLAQALLVSCRRLRGSTPFDEAVVPISVLPSPCAPVACTVHEMDEIHDSLSGASFAFLFPVLRACLAGPRTPPGCEACLRVVDRHAALLAGERFDATVAGLRREMVISILELLKHDRAQTFHDPTPFEALEHCYACDSDHGEQYSLRPADLSPLLDRRGALGAKLCRVGSMVALAYVAEHHPHLVRNNPLVENRIWLNCFDVHEDVKTHARKAWLVLRDSPVLDSTSDTGLPPPSPFYAPALIPLLSSDDETIAVAAATAFACAMEKHPSSVARNIETLCKTYIDSFPSVSAEDQKTDIESKILTQPKKAVPVASSIQKKPISAVATAQKVKPVKKSPLLAAGIGQPKIVKKKKTSVVASTLLKPKQERTLDQEQLESQFKVSGEKKDEDKDSSAKVLVRRGVLRAIAALTDSSVNVVIDELTLKLLTSFLMAYGIADGNDGVKGAARNALRDVVASKGDSEAAIAFLLPHLEHVLNNGIAEEDSLRPLPTIKIPRDIAACDRRKEGAVVALGSVALHLRGPENDSKVDSTVDMLLSALKTPSEDVQRSVADALTKLIKKGRTQDRIETILIDLMSGCLAGTTLAAQRGSAYGLSAVVKGSGIAALKKFDVVKQLDEACAAGSSQAKEGALFAIELLSDRLGLLFEPYVIALLPSLLKSFSDNSDHVRKAAARTTEVIMWKLSAHGVKLVLPAVLTAFNDPTWRTKQASIHMLGAMSHLAPKQLASALPKVVPQLSEAFSDTHPKVKAAAHEALYEISTVVRNPEISSIAPVLLKALTDPADYTTKALEVLIETEFLHSIDAPSLALIAPILHRGLRDRGATTKRFGGLITGNITTMINDPKDLLPYLPVLLPDLQATLLDPMPDVRSTSAKALGSLTRSLGDHILPELRPWLVKKLREEGCSSAERSGAAQGLTEVLIAAGGTFVDEFMRNDILPLQSSTNAGTREGVLWMLTFLPPALGQAFTPLIDASLPALIAGLSDDSEPVRDVAMRAGRVLIRSHGKVHVDKFLPCLEDGLGNDDHRIRVASLSLLGDLLSMIGGTTLVKGDGDTQDDFRRAERAQAQIALVLGADTRRRVLSGLYLARSDSVHVVRQSALQVWKTVVSVTGRTLRDILPVLISKIIDDLASGNIEKTFVAGRCLGDVVGKRGESVLPQVIPVLRNALYNGDEDTKRGVCVGLTEVIRSSTKEQILKYIEIIVKVIQDALCDDDQNVRSAAATTFQSLYSVVGSRAFDEIVPSLMVALENRGEAERVQALNGLTGILSVQSRELLPYIIPRLIQRPFTLDRAKALPGIATVTGSTLYLHYSTILPALLGELAEIENEGTERSEAIRECARYICASVGPEGLNILVSEIASKCSSDKAVTRREACWLLGTLVVERADKRDFYDQVPIILRELVYRLNDDDASVLKANFTAFSALSKLASAEELVNHVEFMRNLIASMVSESRRRKGGVGDGEFFLPGFNMSKGLEPLFPIYQRGILYGSPAIREVSAAGLGEIIELTGTKYLDSALMVKMTGPLLRIIGDRNPSNVKIAILKTLGLILVKGGPALRAFVPQFQTTFVKALSDPSRQVRVEAINALSLLMPLSTRVDPLVKELVSGSLGKNINAEGLAAVAIQTATLEALAVVLSKSASKVKVETSVPSALEASKELLKVPDAGIREAAAKVMGEACSALPANVTIETIREIIFDSSDDESSEARHGKACAIRRILASQIGTELKLLLPELTIKAVGYLSDDKSMVREAGCCALGAVIGRSPDPKKSFTKFEPDIMKILGNSRESMEMHRAMARGLCIALIMIDGPKRVDVIGLTLLDACLKLALSGAQRVQFAYNDVLWLALSVSTGDDGLNAYSNRAVFENVRSMKSLHSKVLSRMTEAIILKD